MKKIVIKVIRNGEINFFRNLSLQVLLSSSKPYANKIRIAGIINKACLVVENVSFCKIANIPKINRKENEIVFT